MKLAEFILTKAPGQEFYLLSQDLGLNKPHAVALIHEDYFGNYNEVVALSDMVDKEGSLKVSLNVEPQ